MDNLKHIQLVVCPIHSKAEEEACIPLVHNLQEKSSCSQFKEKNTSGKNDLQKNLNLQKKPLYTICKILYLNPPTNQINLPQLIRSHKKQ